MNLTRPFDSVAELINGVNSAVIIDDMTRVEELFTQLRAMGEVSFRDILKRNPDTLLDVLSRIETLWLNPLSVELFEADSHQQLLDSLPQAYTLEPEPFIAFLDSMFRGERFMQTEFSQPTMKGNVAHVCVASHITQLQDRLVSICTFTDTAWFSQQKRVNEVQSRYTRALSGTELGIWELCTADQIYKIDSQFCRLMGFDDSLPSIRCQELADLSFESDRELLTSMPGDDVFDRQIRMRRADGKQMWIHQRGAVTEHDANGRPLSAAGTIADATDARRQQELHDGEKQLLEASVAGLSDRELLRLLAECVDRAYLDYGCHILLFDSEQRICEAETGSSLDSRLSLQVRGKPASYGKVSSMGRSPGKLVCLQSIANSGLPDTMKQVYADAGVQSIAGLPIMNGNDEIGSIFLLSSASVHNPDVTGLERVARVLALLIEGRRQASRQELREQQDRNQHRFESLGRLAGGIAHDFNNLLTTILVNAELCELSKSEPQVVEKSAKIVQDAASVAASLCEQMLTYAGKVESEPEPLDLNVQVRRLVALVESSIGPHVTVDLQCGVKLPRVFVDVGSISQVILNLLTNAVEAISGTGTVFVKTSVCNPQSSDVEKCIFGEHLTDVEYVSLVVSDNGCGIDKGIQDHLFDPFYSTKSVGRGLGLSTVLGIVKQHRGAISLNSENDQGASFTVFFPVADRVSKNDQSDVFVSKSNERRNVLVVEDQVHVRESIVKLLGSLSVESVAVPSGSEALAALDAKSDFDAILMDQQMPQLSGLATYRKLREQGFSMPVWFMTGFAATQELDAVCRLDGNTELLRKPFRRKQLQDLIEKIPMSDRSVRSGL